jgi:hypothetical protein
MNLELSGRQAWLKSLDVNFLHGIVDVRHAASDRCAVCMIYTL